MLTLDPLPTAALALAAGAVIGLLLGGLGAGGSILAVPVLVLGLGQSPGAAATGSLLVVAVTAAVAALGAHRQRRVLWARGLVFGTVGIGGAVLGSRAAAGVPDDVLLAAFAALMLIVGTVLLRRILRGRDRSAGEDTAPLIAWRPHLQCRCRHVAALLLAATGVGLLTGFLGVGGGFLVVPALVLLGLPISAAVGTSLVAVVVTSTGALAARLHAGPTPEWWPVLLLTAAAVVVAVPAQRWAAGWDSRRLEGAFAVLVLGVGGALGLRSLVRLLPS